MATRDNLIQENSEMTDFPYNNPYLRKEMLIIEDTNGSSDYGRNIVKYEPTALSNNGLYMD